MNQLVGLATAWRGEAYAKTGAGPKKAAPERCPTLLEKKSRLEAAPTPGKEMWEWLPRPPHLSESDGGPAATIRACLKKSLIINHFG